jgi:hypothetical protein
MTNYAPLVTEWATITSGNPATSIAFRLNVLAGVTVTGSIPTLFTQTGQSIFACINYTEVAALTAQNQNIILAICQMPTITSGSASNLAAGGFFPSIFPPTGPTIAALAALATATPQPWWQANGFLGPINANDIAAAGLS